MKSSQELLYDLADELQILKNQYMELKGIKYQYEHNDLTFDKAQQLIGQIRYALRKEWIEDNVS